MFIFSLFSLYYIIRTHQKNSHFHLSPFTRHSCLRLCTNKSPTLSAFISDKGNSSHSLEKCEGVKRLNAYTPSKAFEKIMKSRYVNLPKEEGCDFHLEPESESEEKQPVVTPSHFSSAWQQLPLSPIKADKVGDLFVQRRKQQRLDDAETLNRIHHHMLSQGGVIRFQQLQEKVKQLSHPDILQSFTDFRDKKTSWIEPINIGSGELWEKFQQDGELW